jgi:hypothetical protein
MEKTLVQRKEQPMRSTLIAIATAGVLASTGALAANGPVQSYHDSVVIPAQYQPRWDDRSASINDREARINERIQRGINDGRITEREARRLHRELNAIEAKEQTFMSDGRLNRRETDELNRDLNRLADHVRQQIRDEQHYQ